MTKKYKLGDFLAYISANEIPSNENLNDVIDSFNNAITEFGSTSFDEMLEHWDENLYIGDPDQYTNSEEDDYLIDY